MRTLDSCGKRYSARRLVVRELQCTSSAPSHAPDAANASVGTSQTSAASVTSAGCGAIRRTAPAGVSGRHTCSSPPTAAHASPETPTPTEQRSGCGCSSRWRRAAESAFGSGPSGTKRCFWSEAIGAGCTGAAPELNGAARERVSRSWREKGERRPCDWAEACTTARPDAAAGDCGCANLGVLISSSRSKLSDMPRGPARARRWRRPEDARQPYPHVKPPLVAGTQVNSTDGSGNHTSATRSQPLAPSFGRMVPSSADCQLSSSRGP